MQPISYDRHRYPAAVIRQAVWLYFRFTLSQWDVEDLMAERGVDVSYETIRSWTREFGALFAGNLRRSITEMTGKRTMINVQMNDYNLAGNVRHDLVSR
jgi:transposase-like protein